MALPIKGFQKLTMIDYPGKIACTIFLLGCNFRCGYCHNRSLVLEPQSLPTISEDYILNFLKEKKRWLDGVVISGGEPTLHKDLKSFIKKIKEISYCVKLDTNGTSPETVKKLIDEKLVDYIAMDIKAPLKNYSEVAGVFVDTKKIEETIGIIKKSRIPYEFRTTMVPCFTAKGHIIEIGKLLNGSKLMFLQQFRPCDSLIDPSVNGKKPHSIEELEEFKDILKSYILNVEIRPC